MLSALAVRFAGSAPTLAAALTVSAFNVGFAAGSLLAGLTLNTRLGLTGPPPLGALITGATTIPLLTLRHRDQHEQLN